MLYKTGMNTFRSSGRIGERLEYEHVPFAMLIRWQCTQKYVTHERKKSEQRAEILLSLLSADHFDLKTSAIGPILKKVFDKKNFDETKKLC